jgi:hypothetical protein
MGPQLALWVPCHFAVHGEEPKNTETLTMSGIWEFRALRVQEWRH